MTRTARHRPQSRAAYQEALTNLKARHPWLARQVVEPAPGHLAVLEHFVEQCELLMKQADYRHLPLFCATTQRDKLSLRVELVGASINRDRALLDLIKVARDAAQQHCPVCSAPVIGGDANVSQGVRCKRHEATIGLYTEDLKRNQKLAVAQGLLTPTAKPEKSIRDEPLDSSINGAVHALLQALPDMTPPTSTPEQLSQPESRATPQIAFLEAASLHSFVERHRAKPGEKAKRAQYIAERIRAAGHEHRRLGELPDDWAKLIEDFQHDFPNFAELAEVLHDHFALHAMGDGRVAWSPILLVGPAGIGKTEAARWLAERLSLPFRVIDMASTQSNAPLAGSESYWSNSESGVVFELLAYQPQANPVVVLDELDKTDQQRQYDPLAGLYTLLEPRCARDFIDLSIRDFAIDASHVNWIATANSTDGIPAPLLSRMTVLNVQAPTSEQVAYIAQSIYGRMRAENSWGSAFAPKLEEEVVAKLSQLPPRSLGLVLRRALGRVAREQRDHVLASDLTMTSNTARRKIGFMS